jgi:hypothetical protein
MDLYFINHFSYGGRSKLFCIKTEEMTYGDGSRQTFIKV